MHFHSREHPDYMLKVVGAMGHQLHQFRYFYLELDSNICIGNNVVLCDNLSTTLCDGNPKLKLLQLKTVPMSHNMLLDLCSHPNLQTLNLSGGRLHDNLTEEEWVSFSRKLKEQEQGNCSGGSIRSISLNCDYWGNVRDEVLEEFAGIKSLENVRIERNTDITDASVDKFASIKSNISKSYMNIELYDCIEGSADNPHVAFVPSPVLDCTYSSYSD